jgi:hypothetical protein
MGFVIHSCRCVISDNCGIYRRGGENCFIGIRAIFGFSDKENCSRKIFAVSAFCWRRCAQF